MLGKEMLRGTGIQCLSKWLDSTLPYAEYKEKE